MTLRPETKPLPRTVKENLSLRAGTLAGDSSVIAGTPTTGGSGVATTLKFTAFDNPPPGGGVNTSRRSDPTAAISAAGNITSSSPCSGNVVVRASPLILTTEFPVKPDPRTRTKAAGAPARTSDGTRDLIAGTAASRTPKVTASEVPSPGVVTRTSCGVAEVSSDAGIEACNSPMVTNVVLRSIPSQVTTELGSKSLPRTVSWRVDMNDAGIPDDGLRDCKTGGLGTAEIFATKASALLKVPRRSEV